jgi:hypothetical protein
MERKYRFLGLIAAATFTAASLTGCAASEATPQAIDQPPSGSIAYRLPGCRVEPIVRNQIIPGTNPPEFKQTTRANFVITPPPGGEIINVLLTPVQSRFGNSSVFNPALGPVVVFRGTDNDVVRIQAFDSSCNPLESTQFQSPSTP